MVFYWMILVHSKIGELSFYKNGRITMTSTFLNGSITKSDSTEKRLFRKKKLLQKILALLWHSLSHLTINNKDCKFKESFEISTLNWSWDPNQYLWFHCETLRKILWHLNPLSTQWVTILELEIYVFTIWLRENLLKPGLVWLAERLKV